MKVTPFVFMTLENFGIIAKSSYQDYQNLSKCGIYSPLNLKES